MNKRLPLLVGFTILLAPLVAVPLFWSVESGNAKVYLLGSMHAGTPDLYPLPAFIDEAYLASDALVVEADVSEAKQREIAGKMLSMAMYPDGQTIADHLPAELVTRVDTRLREYGLNITQLNRMKPWMLGMSLLSMEMQRLHYDTDLGIDLHYLHRAAADSLEIIELEGLDYQINLFNSFNDTLQAKFLEDILDNQTEMLNKMNELTQAWKDGDEATLEKLVTEDSDNPAFAGLYEALIYQRNTQMVAKIEQYLKTGRTYFLIVGAGHLVGERGIVDLLQKAGYKVQKL